MKPDELLKLYFKVGKGLRLTDSDLVASAVPISNHRTLIYKIESSEREGRLVEITLAYSALHIVDDLRELRDMKKAVGKSFEHNEWWRVALYKEKGKEAFLSVELKPGNQLVLSTCFPPVKTPEAAVQYLLQQYFSPGAAPK